MPTAPLTIHRPSHQTGAMGGWTPRAGGRGFEGQLPLPALKILETGGGAAAAQAGPRVVPVRENPLAIPLG